MHSIMIYDILFHVLGLMTVVGGHSKPIPRWWIGNSLPLTIAYANHQQDNKWLTNELNSAHG